MHFASYVSYSLTIYTVSIMCLTLVSFSMLSSTYRKRSITKCKTDSLHRYGSRCLLSYQLSSHPLKRNLQLTVTFPNIFLEERWAGSFLNHPIHLAAASLTGTPTSALILLVSPFMLHCWHDPKLFPPLIYHQPVDTHSSFLIRSVAWGAWVAP